MDANIPARFCLITLLVLVGAGLGRADSSERMPAGLPLPDQAPAWLDDPPAGRFLEEWHEVRLDGAKAGYSRTFHRRRGNEIITDKVTRTRVRRDQAEVRQNEEMRLVETIEGEPVRFRHESSLGEDSVVIEGTFESSRLKVELNAGKEKQVIETKVPESTVMLWGLKRALTERPAGTFSLAVYYPSMVINQPLDVSVRLGEWERRQNAGHSGLMREVDMTLETDGASVHMRSRIDHLGRALETHLASAGFPLETYLVGQEQALAAFTPREIFLSSLLPLQRGVPAKAREVVYRLWREDGRPLDLPLPQGRFQLVRELESGAVEVTAKRIYPNMLPTRVNSKLSQPASLADNPLIDTSDPRLHELASQALKEQLPHDLARAQALRAFVHGFMRETSLSVAFGSANEVAHTATGDCSEYAVLLAALGRVEKIPTRLAAGLVYLPTYRGHSQVMGYHMWTQMKIGQDWVDFDATRPEGGSAVRHIALVTTTMEDTSLPELSLRLLDLIGNLRVEVLRIQE